MSKPTNIAFNLACLAVAFAVFPNVSNGGRKILFVVAIDKYKSPEIPTLSGCTNDASSIGATLRTYGFPGRSREGEPGHQDYHVLLNEKASRDAILDECDAIVESTTRWESGSLNRDLVYVQFSCHGSQQKDVDGDEAQGDRDGRDETILAWDSRFDGTPDISDDELYERLFQPLLEKNVKVVVVFDCCHSGDLSRDPIRQSRWVDPVDPLPVLGTDQVPSAAAAVGGRVKSGLIQLAACKSYQVASEHPPNGYTRGVLTTALVETLDDARVRGGKQESYSDLFRKVEQRVATLSSEQNPVIYGPDELLGEVIFQTESLAPQPFVVAKRHGESSQLVDLLMPGSLLGVGTGTEFRLFGRYEQELSNLEKLLAEATVEDLSDTDLAVTARSDRPLERNSYRAVVSKYVAGGKKLRVWIRESVSGRIRALLKTAIQKSPLLEVSSSGRDAELETWQTKNGLLHLQTNRGQKLGAFEEMEATIVKAERFARWRALLDIDERNGQSEVQVALSLESHGQLLSPTEGRVVVNPGQRCRFRVVLQGSYGQKIHVGILAFREAAQTVRVIYESTEPFEIGDGATLENEFARLDFPFGNLPDGFKAENLWLKVFASTEPIPLAFIEMKEPRLAQSRGEDDALTALLRSAVISRGDTSTSVGAYSTQTLPVSLVARVQGDTE